MLFFLEIFHVGLRTTIQSTLEGNMLCNSLKPNLQFSNFIKSFICSIPVIDNFVCWDLFHLLSRGTYFVAFAVYLRHNLEPYFPIMIVHIIYGFVFEQNKLIF